MSDDELFVAVDVGTTGARASAVSLDGTLRRETRQPYQTVTPRPGWAEQDPRDWRRAGLGALVELTSSEGIDPGAVRAIGLTGQCPTVAPFGRDREPVGPGLLYRDNRAVAQAGQMRRRWGEEAMHARTGHVASAFHVGPKVLWWRECEPSVFAAGDCFMQPRDVVLQALTGRTATDQTHANSTLFYDLRARDWALDLLDDFGLGADLFPPVLAPWEVAGDLSAEVCSATGIGRGCPVVIGAADSQCAAYGSDVVGPGTISEMAGASSCLNSVVTEPAGDVRITHYSYVLPDVYCTELGVNTTGAALSWALTQWHFPGFTELEQAATRVRARLGSGSYGDPRLAAPIFLPYLGDGDRDDPTLRAALIGLSDRHARDEVAYAVLEGVAFAVAETVSLLVASGSPLGELRVGGGGARIALLGQLKADVLGAPVLHLRHDSAPVGAALLAAARCGFADQAQAGLTAALDRAQRFEPDAACAGLVNERYRWFLELRDSAAVRLAS
ncbi:MAG TPA: FGGY family carbohydrate kinase [Solirubrobacteraceae bacterium]|jgi:sugar (pentulose or hexulose) kinase|nr:FGGY family carbohydrate kinase [Solirubrobacteraceae bacterium]